MEFLNWGVVPAVRSGSRLSWAQDQRVIRLVLPAQGTLAQMSRPLLMFARLRRNGSPERRWRNAWHKLLIVNSDNQCDGLAAVAAAAAQGDDANSLGAAVPDDVAAYDAPTERGAPQRVLVVAQQSIANDFATAM